MRNLWREFKAFAMSGNVLDLALGFLIGAAFAGLVQSLANNVLMQLVAAAVGKPDFSKVAIKLNGTEIRYGAFLTDLLNFLILASVMFAVVKLIVRLGIAQIRNLGGSTQCPYCHESVSEKALVCRACGHVLVDELPDLAAARQRMVAEERARMRLSLPIPSRRRTTPDATDARATQPGNTDPAG